MAAISTSQELNQVIRQHLADEGQLILAIDGSCASGKTTLAHALAAEFNCNLFHMDDFFLRPEQRTLQRLAQPGGNVDYERFRKEVLEPLVSGSPFSYRPYSCRLGELTAPVEVMPKPLSIIEGSYSHHPYFGDAYGLRIFLTVTDDLRRQRIEARPAFLHARFFNEWIPLEQRYFTHFSIPERADLIVDTLL